MGYDYAKVARVAAAITKARDDLREKYEAEDKALAGQLEQIVTVLADKDGTATGDQLTSTYLLLRASKHAAGRLADRIEDDHKARMESIEVGLLARLTANSAKSMATTHGTFYREEVMKPSVTDWSAFYTFIGENNAYEALEKRVTKAFVQNYVEEHRELPPGVVVHREVVVRVRTANEKA